MQGHSSLEVANQLLIRAHSKKRQLTPMQLIKLTYIAHGWMLGLYNRELIFDEIQAWKFGPVIPGLYQAVKRFRNGPVNENALAPQASVDFDSLEQDLIEQVYDKYGHLTGFQLSSMTHQPSTPWDIVWNKNSWSAEIPNDTIRTHYAGLAEGAQLCP